MEEYIKITKQAAYSFCKRDSDKDKDEIFAEAYLAMAEAMISWDPVKGRTLKSWIGFMVHRHLRNTFWRKKQIFFDDIDVETLTNNKELNAEEQLISIEKKNELSTTARDVIELLLEKDFTEKKNETKRQIKNELVSKGVSQRHVQRTFRELKTIAAQI